MTRSNFARMNGRITGHGKGQTWIMRACSLIGWKSEDSADADITMIFMAKAGNGQQVSSQHICINLDDVDLLITQLQSMRDEIRSGKPTPYEEGFRAGSTGVPMKNNPYDVSKDFDAFHSWNAGHDDGC